MPEATQDIHDSAALGERVDALVSDAAAPPASNGAAPPPAATPAPADQDPLAEAAAVLSQLGDPDPAAPIEPGTEPPPEAPEPKEPADSLSPAPAAPPAPATDASPEPAAAATAQPVEAPAGSPVPTAASDHKDPAAPAATPPEPSAAASDEDLAKAVEKLIGETGASPDAESSAPAPASDRIESLDAELAGIADDMIAGEFADESEVLSADAAPEPTAKAAPAAPEAPAPSEPLPVPQPAAPAAPPPPAPAPAATHHAPSILLRVFWALSSPLRGKPAHVRDAVGWMALVQAFLALWVVSYILFLRSNEPPLPTAPVPAAKATDAKHETEGAKEGGEGGEKASAKKDKKVHKATHPPKKKGGESKEE